MLTTLIAALAFQSPNLDKPVTLRTPAKPVAEVLADVTTQVGFRFEASQVREWPIIVSVKSFRAGDLLDRIAEVTDSEWVKERDRWVLTRSAARVKKAVEIELADRAARLKPVVDALPTEMSDADIEKAVADINRLIEDARQMQGGETAIVGGPSASVVLLNEILRRLPIKQLAEAPISSFLSYSTVPRPGQSKLTAIPRQAWTRYLETQDRLANKIVVPPNIKVSGAVTATLPREVNAVLTLGRPMSTANVIAGLYLFDDQGAILDMSRTTLAPVPASFRTVSAPSKAKIQLSDEGIGVMRALHRINPSAAPNFRSMGGEMIPIHPVDPWTTRENIAIVRQLIDQEPFAFHHSDWMLDLASQSSKNLIAYLPDHVFKPLTARLEGNSTHESVWNDLPALGIDRVVAGDTILLKPKMFARADRYRVSRSALRTLVKESGPYGIPKLIALASYASKAPLVAYAENLDTTLLEVLFRRNHIINLQFQERVDSLRLLSLWLAMVPSGEKLTQAEALNAFAPAYDRFLRSSVAARASYTTIGGANFGKIGDFDPFAGTPSRGEVPVILRMGKKLDGVLIVLEDGKAAGLSPIGLGTFLGLRPENFTGFQPMLRIAKMHPASLFNQSLVFRAGASGVNLDFTDVDADLDQTWSLDQLPAAWRSEIERGRGLGAITKVSSGFSGGNVPP